MKTKPWHSKKTYVYHNNTKCTLGNNIERKNILLGTGGKIICNLCSRLNKSNK